MPISPPRGTPLWAAERALNFIRRDAPFIDEYDQYLDGEQRSVYIPDNADAEFKLLAERATVNLIPLVINSVTQVCYVDSIRHSIDVTENGNTGAGEVQLPPEMEVWQRNNMDSRQLANVRATAAHGLSYLLTRKVNGKARFEFYNARRAMAIFDDPVNDVDPEWGFVIKKGTAENFQKGLLFSDTEWWEVSLADSGGAHQLRLKAMGKHGNSVCPLSRAALHQDLYGGAVGLIAPIIRPQDQVNQTSFDILAIQSYGSFKIRTATGMAIPIRRWTRAEIDAAFPEPSPAAEDYEAQYADWLAQDRPNVGDPVLDQNGQEIPLPIKMNQKRMLIAEDPDTKFGQLEETDVRPLLAALDSRVKLLAALSQTPPTYLMGEMANLSAEALQAAEISKTRRDREIQTVLAEQYERSLRLAMELEQRAEYAADHATEIVWADMDPRSMSAIADAFGKLAEQLGVPVTALWEDLPGMTSGKLKHWLDIRKKDRDGDPDLALANALDNFEVVESGGDRGRTIGAAA